MNCQKSLIGLLNSVGRIFLILAIGLISISGLKAQPSLSASVSSARVPLNATFQVTYTLKGGTAETFSQPSFTGFSLLGTSRTSGGGVTVIVNGQVVQGGDGNESWVFTLKPSAMGKFTIGAAQAVVGGKTLTSNTLTVEITKATTTQAQNQNQNQGAAQQGVGSDNGSIGPKDLFIRAAVDKTSAMQGEQVTLTYKLYSRVQVSQYAITKLSSFNGFWNHDLLDGKSDPIQSAETIDGNRYNVWEIRKVALFAQKSGKLTIEPLEIECLAQVRVKSGNNLFDSFFNDPFFNNSFFQSAFSGVQNVKKTIQSNAIEINIQPLPNTNKPTLFSGAVGSYSFTGSADRTRVKQNEPIHLIYKVEGRGNVNLIDNPQIEFPPDFEVYDPEITDDISIQGGKLLGTRTWEYLVIPRAAGKFEIKAVTFNYFDLDSRTYKNISLPEISFDIGKGDGTGAMATGSRQEDVKMLGSDIRFMNPATLPLQRHGRSFFNSLFYYLVLLAPTLLFILFAIIWRRRLKLRSNAALLRTTRATAVARKHLKQSAKYLQAGNQDAFYVELSRALWGYISDKFNIPLSELSLEVVNETLAARQLPEQVLSLLTETLNECEYARFAPGDPQANMELIFANASSVIRSLESKSPIKKS